MRLARILAMASSSSHSRRRAMGMAASDQGDTSAHATKKARVRVSPDSSDSEVETVEDHGHEEGDGSEEEEKEEESQGEPDGDGDDEEEGEENFQDPWESDGDGVDEEESAGEMAASEPAPSTRAAVAGVTVEDADALECGVCCLPLRPPIFQCEVGHAVCSPCRDKLAPAGKCHVCGVAVAGYRRCHAVETLVDSIRVACPHAAHGCATRPAYHGLDAHRLACPHAPCHCPGDGCGFVGSTAALLDHFAAAHNWPCTTNVRARELFDVRLHDGFNFLASHHHLIMMNMTREPLGRAISVLCIHPHATGRIQCEVSLWRHAILGDSWGLYRSHYHYQKSVFDVGCSDLADGLPDRKQCFQFVVPRCVVGDDDESGTGIRINALITVN